MHSAGNSVRVISNPHISILIHHSAVGIEDIIIVAYFCKALGALAGAEIESLSVALNKAVGYELSVAAESVPTDTALELAVIQIECLIGCNLLVGLNIVIVAVKLIESL